MSDRSSFLELWLQRTDFVLAKWSQRFRDLGYRSPPEKERNHEQDEEDKEDDARDIGGCCGDAAKAKDCRNDCNHQEQECPT